MFFVRPSVVASLSWPDRGHHVPTLTVTSGGRGVGFDMHAWGRLVVHFPASSPLGASVPSLHLHARCSSFVRKDRRCPDLDAESRTGCRGSLGANSSPGAKACKSPKCASASGPKILGFLSGRGHHVPAKTTLLLSCCACFCLLVAVAHLAGRWCFWRLFGGFGFSFSVHAGHRANSLSGSFRVLIATGSSLKLRGTYITCRACGPTESLTSATVSGC